MFLGELGVIFKIQKDLLWTKDFAIAHVGYLSTYM